MNKYLKSARKLLAKARRWFAGGKKILVLCDSHGGVLEYIHDHGLLAPHYINCEVVGGATAYGLNNDQSKTQAFLKFSRALKRFPAFDVVGIMLGEVDCSVALWGVAEKRGVASDELIPHVMQGYQRLIDFLRAGGKSQIILFGSILPTVSDAQKASQADSMRRNVRASQQQTTALVLAVNAQLKKLALTNGVAYLDITEETLDKKTGLVSSDFLISGRVDHHQSQSMTAPLWCRQLRKIPILAEPAVRAR